jgi:hypothetical protein
MGDFRQRVLDAWRAIEGIEDEERENRRLGHEIKTRLREARHHYQKLMAEELHPERAPLLQHIEAKERASEGQAQPVPEGQPPGTVGHPHGSRAIADGPAEVDPDAWRKVSLEEALGDQASDALWTAADMVSLGDLADFLADGDSLEELPLGGGDITIIRERVETYRRSQGWAADQGIPRAWLGVSSDDAEEPGTPQWKMFEVVYQDRALPPFLVEAVSFQDAREFAGMVHPVDARLVVEECEGPLDGIRADARVYPASYDHTADDERNARGEKAPYYVKKRELTSAWRERQEAGLVRPEWGFWCEFDVAIGDGTMVRVLHKPRSRDTLYEPHLEFYGPISETGYRSHHVPEGEVKKGEGLLDFARRKAEELHADAVAKMARKLRQAKKRRAVDPVTGEDVPKPKRSRKAKPSPASA